MAKSNLRRGLGAAGNQARPNFLLMGVLRQELAAVDEMVAFAEHVVLKPDARVQWLAMDKGEHAVRRRWNNRRLIIFTEWEDTRRWVEKRLRESFG